MKIRLSLIMALSIYFCFLSFTALAEEIVEITEEIVFVEQRRHVPEDLKEGQRIYNEYCKWCHGVNGEGRGPARPFMYPPPRDFTFGSYKYRTTLQDDTPLDSDIAEMIRKGMNSTAMPAYEDILSEEEIWKVVGVVRNFSELFMDDDEPYDPEGQIQFSEDEPPNDAESIAIGREVFYEKAKCVECHGEEGRGDGKVERDDWGSKLWPRDLTRPWTFKFGISAKELYRTITTGIVGTPMPSFIETLTSEDRWHVAHFEMTLQDPSRKPTGEKVITSKRVEGDLPIDPDDQVWKTVRPVTFPLVGQMIVEPKLFNSFIDNITVRSVYNNQEVAFLLIWGDRTNSPTKDDIDENPDKAGHDAVAIEFSLTERTKGLATIGMIDSENPVRIVHWNNKDLLPKEFIAFDFRKIQPFNANLQPVSQSVFQHGLWKVVIKSRRTVKFGENKQMHIGKPSTPIAFAVWDGSNNEKGGKHTLSDWYDLILEE